jgi:hypothetical protein
VQLALGHQRALACRELQQILRTSQQQLRGSESSGALKFQTAQ